MQNELEEIAQLKRRMGRLFFGDGVAEEISNAISPFSETREVNNQIIIRFEMPGVNRERLMQSIPEDYEAEYKHGFLTVRIPKRNQIRKRWIF